MSDAVVAPYKAACAQLILESCNPDVHGEFPAGLKERNLQRICDYIDLACTRTFPQSFLPPPVRLIAFPEFSLGGYWNIKTTTKEVQQHLAISIPGPETHVLAEKAKQHNCYIAAANYENDPEYPNWCFNTAFIINPEGKVILKYRKTHTSSQPFEWGCTAHDILDVYKNPITGTFDPFPVVDTEIGRLGMMVCGDIALPEIPRIYGMKGCEVLIYVTAGHSEAQQWCLRSQAFWNTMYIMVENYAAVVISGKKAGDAWVIEATEPALGGWAGIFDYRFILEPVGNIVARAEDSSPQVVIGVIDIMALRQAREKYLGNNLVTTRTELYAPYYTKTIFPPNRFLEVGSIKSFFDEAQLETQKIALENLRRIQQNPENWYSEKDVK